MLSHKRWSTQAIDVHASSWLHTLEVGYSFTPAFMVENGDAIRTSQLASQAFQRLQPHHQTPLLAYQHPVAAQPVDTAVRLQGQRSAKVASVVCRLLMKAVWHLSQAVKLTGSQTCWQFVSGKLAACCSHGISARGSGKDSHTLATEPGPK